MSHRYPTALHSLSDSPPSKSSTPHHQNQTTTNSFSPRYLKNPTHNLPRRNPASTMCYRSCISYCGCGCEVPRPTIKCEARMRLEQTPQTKEMTSEEILRCKVRCDFDSVVEDVQFRFGVCRGCEELPMEDWEKGMGKGGLIVGFGGGE